MAEQKAPESAPAMQAEAPASKPILFIILAVVNMLVVAGVGAMIYLGKKKEEAQPTIDHIVKGEHEAEEHEKANPQFIGKLIPLETFIVNLAGSRGQRIAKINMELEVSNDDVSKEIDKLRPKIRDIIIFIVSSKQYAQVSTREGKDSLREEIKEQLNLFLTKGAVSRVYFTEFIYN
jgi:flagellar protein FliL